MFSKIITQTPMTSPPANEYFRNRITGELINGDVSFLSTLRALIDRRIPKDEPIFLKYGRSSYQKSGLSDISERDAVKLICDEIVTNCNTLYIHNFSRMDGGESNNAYMDIIEKKFEDVYTGWGRVEKVTAFYRKVFRAICFINPEQKTSVVFVDLSTDSTPLDMRRLHYLQCGIFAFLPWYFNPADGVTDLERELIDSLRDKSEGPYLSCLAKIADAFDFRSSSIRRMLDGFESRYERNRCDQIKSELDRIRRQINSLNQQFAEVLEKKRDYETDLLGLETKIAAGDGESEVMDYFLANKNMILRQVSGTVMEFVVKSDLEFFDEDIAARYLNNDGSFFYRYTGRDVFTKENVRMLMNEIFVEQRLKIRFCAAYRFRIEGNVDGISDYGSYDAECSDCTPNPHIDRYACIGDYARLIDNFLAERDYIGALEQCRASCRSLNIADAPVMDEFMKRICGQASRNKNMRCIVLPDGSVVEPKDAIKWLLNEKKEKEEAETHGEND